jgi:hypothetical protein
MASPQPRYSKEELARRSEAIFARDIRSQLANVPDNQFVAIDIETGSYELDENELAASDRSMARYPRAQIWLRRVGSPHARRFGFHRHSAL